CTFFGNEPARCQGPAVRAAEGQPCNFDCPTEGPCYDEPGSTACDNAERLICEMRVCRRIGQLGEPCFYGDDCVPDTTCAVSGGTGTCVAKSSVGASCMSTSNCVSSSYCAAGICEPAFAGGTPCENSNPCLEGTCEGGVCVATAAWNLCLFGEFD